MADGKRCGIVATSPVVIAAVLLLGSPFCQPTFREAASVNGQLGI